MAINSVFVATLSGATLVVSALAAAAQAPKSETNNNAAPNSITATTPPPSPGNGGGSATKPDEWAKAQIDAELAQCKLALKGVHAVMVPEAPIKEGECGSPVVYKVMSIGKSPAVAVSPPATLSCDMIGSLHTWIKKDLQPLARKHLGGPIVKIINMSSYSCRNAYGRRTARLSEHGRANALDIAGFETAKAGPTLVLNTWGPTGYEMRALAAKAEKERKVAAEKAALEKARTAAGTAGTAKTATPAQGSGAGTAVQSANTLLPAGAPGLVIQFPSPGSAGSTAFGEPFRLGGPGSRKEGQKKNSPDRIGKAEPRGKSTAPDLVSRQTIFIRKAHETACNRFFTVLGPEANRAHKNHFHVDMAERRNGSSYCR